jgi:HTH-type transcriptional regulator/antitoxin HigA
MKAAATQLREWIDRQGIRQNEAAFRLGIDQSFVSHILGGRRTPGLRRAVKIERITGIPAAAWASRRVDTKKAQRSPKSATA